MIEFVKGLVVRSCAGHDKGGFFVVLDVNADMVLICNGKSRNLAHPKRKKRMHLSPTKTVIPNHLMKTNREIYEHLQQFCCK